MILERFGKKIKTYQISQAVEFKFSSSQFCFNMRNVCPSTYFSSHDLWTGFKLCSKLHASVRKTGRQFTPVSYTLSIKALSIKLSAAVLRCHFVGSDCSIFTATSSLSPNAFFTANYK